MAGIDYGEIRLMGATEIARRLGITRQRAYVITSRRDFPAPRWVLTMGSIWVEEEVEAWIEANRPHLNQDPEAL